MEPEIGEAAVALARTAVATSFDPLPPTPAELLGAVADLPALARRAATFVTLERDGTLRGCIGTLRAVRPLGFDVIRNARLAARDPRLEPVRAEEVPALRVEVTVLSPSAALAVSGFAELLDRLRPGEDGLTLKDASGRRATFLPSVWAGLPEPERFVAALLRKGGWPRKLWAGRLRAADWPEGLAAERYHGESFSG